MLQGTPDTRFNRLSYLGHKCPYVCTVHPELRTPNRPPNLRLDSTGTQTHAPVNTATVKLTQQVATFDVCVCVRHGDTHTHTVLLSPVNGYTPQKHEQRQKHMQPRWCPASIRQTYCTYQHWNAPRPLHPASRLNKSDCHKETRPTYIYICVCVCVCVRGRACASWTHGTHPSLSPCGAP